MIGEKVAYLSYLKDSIIIIVVIDENNILGSLLILVVFLEWEMVHRMARPHVPRKNR